MREPTLTSDDRRRLDALPPKAAEMIAPLLNQSASMWTMPKADAMDGALDLVGCCLDEVPLAETLTSAPQRALMELCATHPELGLRGGVVHRWPRWSMRRWLGLDPPGALEHEATYEVQGKTVKGPRWLRFTSTRRVIESDPTLMTRWLEELPMAERLELLGELDANAYGLTTRFIVNGAYAWLELPGLDALRDEGRAWAPRHADWLLELRKPDADPHFPYRIGDHAAIQLPLFLALVRAGIPIERRWEVFLPQCLDRTALFTECIEGLPADRRDMGLAAQLTTFLVVNAFGPHAPPVEPEPGLERLVPLFTKYPPPNIFDELFRRYAAGYHHPKKDVLARLAALSKRFPVLAASLKRDKTKKPLRLAVELGKLPPQDKLTALDKARIAKLDESAYDLLELFEVRDANSDRRWQALLFAGCDGSIFANGSAETVAMIAQEGADGEDGEFCDAFDAAYKAHHRKAKAAARASKTK